MADAIMIAGDDIGLACIQAEDDGREAAEPSQFSQIDVSKGTFFEDGAGIVSLVDVDLVTYRRLLDNKSVRRST